MRCRTNGQTGDSKKATTTLRGVDADAELSASDIFLNLQFGAMGMLVARKDGWGFGADAIWMALGTTVRETNIRAAVDFGLATAPMVCAVRVQIRGAHDPSSSAAIAPMKSSGRFAVLPQ